MSEPSASITTNKRPRDENDLEFKPREIVLTNWTTLAILLSFSTLLTAVILAEVRQIQTDINEITQKSHDVPESPFKYAIYTNGKSEDHLENVVSVLDRLGYTRVDLSENWNLLWAHDYPFQTLKDRMINLKPWQKVNHVPGCGYITNKLDLSTTTITGQTFIPKAFKLPDDKDRLLEYAKSDKERLFVEKNNEHRNIRVVDVNKVDFTSNDSFVQEFIARPYLVDGKKFDIGVYVIITSVDPLRLYYYNGDVLFRYCSKEYHPFDESDVDKYVVGDDYSPVWTLPSLAPLYKRYGYSMRDTFDAYVRLNGRDPSVIWQRTEHALREIVLAKHEAIRNVIRGRFRSQFPNFFEMIRFDFIVDEDFNVYLLEANMSPNLSSAHFLPNKLLYEQVLYNVFGLVGVAERIRTPVAYRSKDDVEMIVADKNIAVFPVECLTNDCANNCDQPECEICTPCMSETVKQTIQNAYNEFTNRGDCKRLFPGEMNPKTDVTEATRDLSPTNRLMYKWFHGKCQQNSEWC